MATPGRFFGRGSLDTRRDMGAWISGFSTFTMPSSNNGCAFRFTATRTDDIKTVYCYWNAVTAGGTVECRIETIDATTGLPTGTLYDASATKSQTPVAGWQAFTFASVPTAGLTVGTEYAVVLITTSGGTTHTVLFLAGTSNSSCYPMIFMSSSTANTRSTLADTANSTPVCTLVYEDDVEEPMWCSFTQQTTVNIFGTTGAGAKIVVPAPLEVVGYSMALGKTGTPAGDLVVKTWDSGDAAVSGLTRTIDKDTLNTFIATKRQMVILTPKTSLAAGTYRIILESQSSANSSNCYNIGYSTHRAAALNSSGHIYTSTTDVTGSPPTWSDNTDRSLHMCWLLDDRTVSGSSTAAYVISS